MDRTARQQGRSAVWMLLALTVTWGILATTAIAAELVPPRPLPHKPTGTTLNIAYFREVSSPDGFQATGSFDRMYFYAGNEVLVAMGKDGLYDPAESLAYAYDVMDDGKRYRFYLRQGVQFQGGYGEVTTGDVAWGLNRIHRKDSGSRWSNGFRAMDRAVEVDRYTVDVLLKEPDANLVIRMFDRASIVHSRKRWEEVGGAAQHKLRPIGTGPYQLVDWQVGVGTEVGEASQVLAREADGRAGEVKVITENRTRLAALQTGEVQVAWLQAEQVPEARKPQHQSLVFCRGGLGWLDLVRWSAAAGRPPHASRPGQSRGPRCPQQSRLSEHPAPARRTRFPPESAYGIDAKELWQGDWLKFDPAAAKKLVQEVPAKEG